MSDFDDDTLPADDGPKPAPPRSDMIGRYMIIGEIGRGGFGVVYAAYDPQLDRKVAVKQLLLQGTPDAEERKRLLREAQALARLSHPNVVQMHDVGLEADGVFVAMEFVEGVTLRTWLQRERRPWSEVVDVFVQAAEGLHAAHAAGLVHGDFKPDNVMLGGDGRVRVMDFGLARAVAGGPGLSDTEAVAVGEAKVKSMTVTHEGDGKIRGTLAYLAPEQFAGDQADEASDQFSYCVALFEALYGKRPFEGDSFGALAYAVMRGQVRKLKPAEPIPVWLRQVVRKGLEVEPGDRWADLGELLAHLRRDSTRRLKRVGFVALILALGGGAGVLAPQLADNACDEEKPSAKMAELWNDARRDALSQALRAGGSTYAETSLPSVHRAIDTWVGDWTAAWVEACERERANGGGKLDARMRCLDLRRRRAGARLEALENPDRDVAERAVAIAEALPGVSECVDLTASGSEAHSDEAAEFRERLSFAEAQAQAGKPDAALEIIDAVAPELARANFGGLRAELELARAEARDAAGEFLKARKSLEVAYRLARRAGRRPLSARALVRLVEIAAIQLKDFDAAKAWAVAARRLTKDGDPRLRARLHRAEGYVALQAGETERAAEVFDAAERVLDDAELDEPLLRLELVRIRGGVFYVRGEYDAALASARDALQRSEQTLGKAHPKTAAARTNVGMTLLELGKVDDALRTLEEAAADVTASVGDAHPTVAVVQKQLGRALAAAGRSEDAAAAHRAALEVREASFGEAHPLVAESLSDLADVLRERGDVKAALPLQRRAVTILERAQGTDDVATAIAFEALGRIYSESGDDENAVRWFEGAVGARERAAPNDAKPLARSRAAAAGARARLEMR